MPPYLRVVDASTCVNDWNSRGRCSAAMPMPESCTEKRMRQVCSSTGSLSTATNTSPWWVNFTALDSRLTRIWRMRVASPTSDSGVPSSIR